MSRKNKIIYLLIFLVGLSLLLYPIVSGAWNNYVNKQLEEEYQSVTEGMSQEEIDSMWRHAIDYNERLHGNYVRDAFTGEKNIAEEYITVLNPTGNGVMGILRIPKLKLELPITHGCRPEDLNTSTGHVEGTTVPTGLIDTEPVLAAHRGMADQKLFTDLDSMKKGDYFYLEILDKEFWYKVDRISTVLPEETEEVQIVPGEEHVALLTCTPFAVNSHRLIVRGIRCEKPTQTEIEKAEKTGILTIQGKLLIAGLAAFMFVMIIQSIVLKRKRNSKKK